MKKQKISMLTLAVFIASLLLFSILASCGGESKNSGEDKNESIAASAEEEDLPERYKIKENLPDVSFGGYEFVVLAEEYAKSDIEADVEIGEIFNDTVYHRNRTVEAKYEIELITVTEAQTSYAAKAKNEIMSGGDLYDLALCHAMDGFGMSVGGVWADWNFCEYVDMPKPWWDQELINSLSFGDKVFAMSGDFNNYSFSMTSAFLFNKNLMQNLNIAYPYDLVKEGKWTAESFQSYIKDVTRDLNGDGIIDYSNDQYGFVGWELDAPYSLSYSFGGRVISKDSDNLPVLEMDLPRTIKIVETLYDIFVSNESFLCTNAMGWGKDYEAFKEGRALFIDLKLAQIEYFKEMEQDFGIVPVPKLDESQKDYISFVNAHSTLMFLPTTISDFERAGIILEALAAESYRRVTPAYYDVVLQIKNTRDEESADMLDYVTRNRIFDMGYMYDLGGLGGYSKELVNSKSRDFASFYEKREKSALSRLEKLVNDFTKD